MKTFYNLIKQPYIFFPFVSAIFFVILLTVYKVNIFIALGLFGLGLFFWTFIEYFTHRYILHDYYTDTIAKRDHGGHHNKPDDTVFFAAPFKFALITAIIITGIIGAFNWFLVSNLIFTLGIMAGAMVGYTAYETTHYLIHVREPSTRYGKWLRAHHYVHHFTDDKYNFGVTTSLWDYVFRTHLKYRKLHK